MQTSTDNAAAARFAREWAFRAPLIALTLLGSALPASAQYAQREQLPGAGPAVDVSGRSIKNDRIRAIHTTDASQKGGTAYLIRKDPFLAYQLGRNLNFREFRTRDGVFSDVSGLAGPMPDGTTAKITANNQVSCAGCHNLPNGNPGGGPNFSKDSGLGRNSPHYYGAGVLEMIALQVRREILLTVDSDGSGWISASEAQLAPTSLAVATGRGPGDAQLDYGNPRLSQGATGVPALNNIFRVWYVDAAGVHVPGATSVDGVTTHGYNFAMAVWGWGQGVGRSALNPTNRAFLWDPFKAHSGLDSHDPSTLVDPDGDGVSAPTLVGAEQFPATHRASDTGTTLDPLGFSRDDPDGDGHLTEISEGDLDLAEFFMLNAPRPAFAGTPAQYQRGLAAFRSVGCTQCHTPDWELRSQEEGFAGDRRYFDLETHYNPAIGRLEGRLEHLYVQRKGELVPRRGEARIEGVFSDLRHHDMGEGFAELDFGGNVNTTWRTPPLWGVASGFPWGHDGASLTLEDAILRHGGEAALSRTSWLSAAQTTRDEVLAFLGRLQLYDIESLPADIDGDGQISASFQVAGQDTGVERFNAEWLFQVPVRIQGAFTNSDGVVVRSDQATNTDQAYGQLLPFRRDSDRDGWPDVWDNAPNTPGFKDGVSN